MFNSMFNKINNLIFTITNKLFYRRFILPTIIKSHWRSYRFARLIIKKVKASCDAPNCNCGGHISSKDLQRKLKEAHKETKDFRFGRSFFHHFISRMEIRKMIYAKWIQRDVTIGKVTARFYSTRPYSHEEIVQYHMLKENKRARRALRLSRQGNQPSNQPSNQAKCGESTIEPGFYSQGSQYSSIQLTGKRVNGGYLPPEPSSN